MQQKNFLLFIVVTFAVIVGYAQLRQWLVPPPPKVDKAAEDETTEAKDAKSSGAPAVRGDGARAALGSGYDLAMRNRPSKPRAAAPKVAPPTELSKLIHLGPAPGESGSRFHLEAALDPRGAGVRQVIANKFAKANKEGRPVWKDKEGKIPEPLELLPEDANRDIPAFALYNFDTRDLSDDHPLNTLGRTVWTVVGDKDKPVTEEQTPDGRKRQSVSFRTEVQGVTVTKTFSLTEGDYHLGLEVKMARREAAPDGKDYPFRYQLAGGRGLPVEGEWYTSTFRNALIARVDDRDNVYRDLQDLRQIALWEGGNEVIREKALNLEYAAVAVQYFASVIAVDDEQQKKDFLYKARPTLETALTKGKLKSISANKDSIVLTINERGEQTFFVPPNSRTRLQLEEKLVQEGNLIAVEHSTDGVMEDGKLRAVATDILPQQLAQPVFVDDITVRVATEPIDLKPGMEVVHKYVLYHGPVKAMLLGQLTGAGAVPPDVVERYVDKLHLNTLTDYHSPGPVGTFASSIYWTQVIIKCTNVMHVVLYYLHQLIPNYGICIIILTIMVRGMMFPVSRKQAMTTIRMQELAPELKKLQEKYKDDRQRLGQAQMELYRKYNVNPFGSCWFVLLQMPVFMGLYYCLQESIHFRLAEFWPTWIINLAAPDMLIHWGDRIPYLSQPENYGGFVYLGPYFNLLPVIAVTLMIFQQKYTMPPPTDEQQAMQQKMMKYMMVFFGLMFYKVAAGLCVYFISSSIWGFTERKLLPKKKPLAGTPPPENPARALTNKTENGSPVAAGSSTAITPASSVSGMTPSMSREMRGGGGKRKKGKRRDGSRGSSNSDLDTAPPAEGIRGWWQARKEKLAAWWQDVLRQAEKKR
jgi:YidC/Oxa1 family membrane protein insertase